MAQFFITYLQYTYIYTYIYIYIHMNTYVYYVYIYIYIYIYVQMYIYICICIYICIYIKHFRNIYQHNIYLSSIYLSNCLSIYLFIYLSSQLASYLSILSFQLLTVIDIQLRSKYASNKLSFSSYSKINAFLRIAIFWLFSQRNPYTIKTLYCKSENDTQLFSYDAECNMGNIFRFSHILQLISGAFRRVK